MVPVATDSWQHSQQWHPHDTRPRFQYAQPPQPQPRPPSPPPDIPVPPRNESELNRETLIRILTHLSTLIPSRFGGLPVRLVIHGGACMLLHPGLYNLALQQHHLSASSPSNAPNNTLPRRTSTRDVDYIKRSFAAEWQRIGVNDAAERLQSCIISTARHFRLGADWMNSDADIALPMANDPSGKPYDPIYTASLQPNNVHLHTIFSSQNGMLTLVSVTPFWAVALKLVRYTKWDPGDICLLLRNGTNLSGTQWTPQMLETWLFQQCWPMGYDSYDWRRKGEMRARIAHAIQMVSNWPSTLVPGNPGTTVTPDTAMGGNDKVTWTDPNPPFVPPPLSRPPTIPAQQNRTGMSLTWPQPSTQVQHDAADSSWTGPQFPQPSHLRSNSHAPIPDLDDWELVPNPRTKSRQQHGLPHPKHQLQPQPQLQPHVDHFNSSVTSMLHTERGPVVPTGVFTKKNENPEASSRRKREKKRASHRKRDRFSKWFRGGYNSADGGSESDDSDDGRDRSQLLHPLDLNRPFQPQDGQQQFHRHPTPHPLAWNNYAREAMPQPQTLAPPHNEPPSRRPSPHETVRAQEMNMRHRHRPPSLDLSETEAVSNSLGLLNF